MSHRYALSLITGPITEPVTLADAKSHLRVDTTDEDAYLSALIKAAREKLEQDMRRAFVQQIWEMFMDCFPDEITIPLPPLVSVTSVKYLDTAGTEQTLATSEYVVDAKSEPGRIALAYGKSWPSTRDTLNAVTVRFVAGYGAAGATNSSQAVPEGIRQAIKFLVAHWYDNREPAAQQSVVPVAIEMTLESLTWQYRDFRFA
ncbi:MAG: head-tail connector protein [Acidobacteria bacterium]|nr:head-tail connector protein [Acidobacteriota bacterium]